MAKGSGSPVQAFNGYGQKPGCDCQHGGAGPTSSGTVTQPSFQPQIAVEGPGMVPWANNYGNPGGPLMKGGSQPSWFTPGQAAGTQLSAPPIARSYVGGGLMGFPADRAPSAGAFNGLLANWRMMP